jgi:hypothetical protein
MLAAISPQAAASRTVSQGAGPATPAGSSGTVRAKAGTVVFMGTIVS